jgi:HPt (histidine-containing phosphotransfer) domain-containing protein
MGDALDRADFDAVTLLGHNMRGSGGAFGFQMITNLGASLEAAADDLDIVASRRLVRELSSFLATLN